MEREKNWKEGALGLDFGALERNSALGYISKHDRGGKGSIG